MRFQIRGCITFPSTGCSLPQSFATVDFRRLGSADFRFTGSQGCNHSIIIKGYRDEFRNNHRCSTGIATAKATHIKKQQPTTSGQQHMAEPGRVTRGYGESPSKLKSIDKAMGYLGTYNDGQSLELCKHGHLTFKLLIVCSIVQQEWLLSLSGSLPCALITHF